MRPSLRQIEAFLAIAAAGSFSRAAERISASQPALSQAVRDLEAMLGVRLFDRTTRRVELTAAGHLFRDQTTKGIEEIDAAVRGLRDLAGLRRGLVRIAAPPLLAATVVPRAIMRFAQAHPGIEFALADVGTDEILARIRSGRADLGVGTFPPGEADLDRRAVLRDDLVLVCPVGHPLGKGMPEWGDLADHAVITLTRDSGIRLLVELGFERVGHTLRPAYEVAQISTALALVEAGLGLAVLPSYAVAASPGRRVEGRALSGPTVGREVSIVTPQGRTAPPAVPAFADAMARELRMLRPETVA